MKFTRNLCLLGFIVLNFYTGHAQAWQQLPDFPSVERDDGVSFMIGDNAYCGTGLKTGWTPCADFYRFNLLSETWDTVASLPPGNERQYASAFSYNGLGYVFAGIGSFPLSDIWEYTPLTNTWTQKTTRPGIGISGTACFVINDKAYFVGGNNGSVFSNEVWMYNITTDSWHQKNNFPGNGIWRASGTALNGMGYLIFGKDNNGNFNAKLYEYNPLADAWSVKSTFLNKGRAYSSLQAIGNNLVVFAGLDSLNTCYNDLWYYSLISSSWFQQISLPAQARKGGMCFSDSTRLYYTTGIDQQDNRLKESWKITYPIAVPKIESKTAFKIYPSICTDYFTIENNREFVFDLEFLNCAGEIVLQQHCSIGLQKVDVRAIKAGLYIIRIRSKSFWQQNKIVIFR